MTKEWADSYLEYFRSLDDAPDDAIPCLLRMGIHGLVWDSIKKKDKVDTFIRYLSPLYYNYNGSFHEYDIELSYFFEGKKIKIGSTSDYIYYIPNHIRKLGVEKDMFDWAIPVEYGNMEGMHRIDNDKVYDLIEHEKPKALRAWKLSIENY